MQGVSTLGGAQNPNGDYFSSDEVAFFIGKLLFCDRFTRDGSGFLPLKDAAEIGDMREDSVGGY